MQRVNFPNSEFVKWEVLSGAEFPGQDHCKTNSGCLIISFGEEAEVNAIFKCEAGKECPPPKPKFKLTVTKTGGTGTGKVESTSPASPKIVCGSECEKEFEEGVKVTLSPTKDPGSKFVEWTGACSGSGACEVTMSEAKSVNAKFDLVPKFKLTVTKTGGTGTGKVESTSPASPKIVCGSECEKEFEEGVKVTLSPAADPGSKFVEWTGACSGSGACEVTMSEAKSVNAKFNLVPANSNSR